MENSYLYYPAPKAYKVLSAFDLKKKGYKVVFSDPDELCLILRRSSFLSKKKFFEVRIEHAKETISKLKVSQIYTDNPDAEQEKDLVQTILRIF